METTTFHHSITLENETLSADEVPATYTIFAKWGERNFFGRRELLEGEAHLSSWGYSFYSRLLAVAIFGQKAVSSQEASAFETWAQTAEETDTDTWADQRNADRA